MIGKKIFLVAAALVAILLFMEGCASTGTQKETGTGIDPSQEKTYKLEESRRYRVKHEVVLTPSGRSNFTEMIVVLPLPDNLQHQQIDGEITVEIQPITDTPVNILSKSPYACMGGILHTGCRLDSC